MTNMRENNSEPTLNPCSVGETNPRNIDKSPAECCDDGTPSQKEVFTNPAAAWKAEQSQKKVGPPQTTNVGQNANCDDLMSGSIYNDLDNPNRQVIYRFSRAIRGNNEAMLDLFRNVYVTDEQGKRHLVPIMWASQERAVAALLQENVRKDASLVVDRVRVPIMSIWNNGITQDLSRFTYQRAQTFFPWLDNLGIAGFRTQEKFERDTVFGVTRGLPIDMTYTLYIWTLYQEDMDQIVEQVLLKFSPVAYIKIRAVYWEVIVKMEGSANNIDIEPGDKLRILKYQFNMTAKTYIPQPITRYKTDENGLPIRNIACNGE